MKKTALLSLSIVTLFIPTFAKANSPPQKVENIFRFHLASEPSSLDPNKQRSATSSFILANLYRNLFYYSNDKGLVADLAESCQRDSKNRLICKLKDIKWSDGTPLTANDFLKTYQKILDVKTSAPRADLLFKIKNAEEIYQGKLPLKSLGIEALDQKTLRYTFKSFDSEFEFNLANNILAPTKSDLSAFTGPYQMKDWSKGKRILLTPNFEYKAGHPQRPPVEVLFIEEDSVALQLYEKNELHYLRRLPTLFIPKFKTRKDFHFYPVIRLDYLGFGPNLDKEENIRKALTYSLNYPELQKIFSSEGRPGCAGLPDSWFPTKAPCFDYDLKKIPQVKSSPLVFAFSALGGEDHKRATEWMQNQWARHAKLQVKLEARENKAFVLSLENNPPDIFRKGVAPERPTCLASLEIFSKGNPENFLRNNSEAYEKIVSDLARAQSVSEKKRLCLAGIDYLMERHAFIPLGAIHFSALVKPQFKGWNLNQMNQLDLSGLYFSP